jgi:hypothetical protein
MPANIAGAREHEVHQAFAEAYPNNMLRGNVI